MNSRARDERGMVLALALVVLVLVGVLVATIYFMGIQEARVGESAHRLEQSFGVVEEGIAEVIRPWDPGVYNATPASPFDSVPVPAGYPAAWVAAQHKTGAYGGFVYKLNGELYFIDLSGRDSLRPGPGAVAGARQRVGVLAHVRPVSPGIEAALTTGKGSRVSGPVIVDGNDRVPPGWVPCGPPDSAKADIRSAAPIAGVGEVTYSQLAAWAAHTLPGQAFASSIGPALVERRCDQAVATNWGDGRGPSRPCGSFFPVVHLVGDASVGGLQGQGILLVDGSLVVRGGLEWYGIVIVRGNLTVVGDGAGDIAIWGAVLVEDSVTMNGMAGRSVRITYSKCPISKALETVATVALVRARGWVGLTDVP